MAIPLEVIDEDHITPEMDAALRQLLCECFPTDRAAFSARRAWNDVWPAFTVLARQGGKVVGQVGIVQRQITCDGGAVRVAGIQSLAVASACRRSGLSQELMTVGMDEARRRGIRHGLLFCVPKLEGFYGRLGWRRTDRVVTMRDAAGQSAPLTAKNICMELALDGDPLPPGEIDLQGRDW